jgi:hypothetical protein
VTLRDRLEELRTRWRRWRLLRAYARVFEVRTGKRVGFTPLMAAYERAERDGVLELVDGEVRWHWPEDIDDREVARTTD